MNKKEAASNSMTGIDARNAKTAFILIFLLKSVRNHFSKLISQNLKKRSAIVSNRNKFLMNLYHFARDVNPDSFTRILVGHAKKSIQNA